jgi:hypothetical protein
VKGAEDASASQHDDVLSSHVRLHRFLGDRSFMWVSQSLPFSTFLITFLRVVPRRGCLALAISGATRDEEQQHQRRRRAQPA